MFSGAFEDLSVRKISVSRRAGVISNVKNLRIFEKRCQRTKERSALSFWSERSER